MNANNNQAGPTIRFNLPGWQADRFNWSWKWMVIQNIIQNMLSPSDRQLIDRNGGALRV
jgi:hypothetical protein